MPGARVNVRAAVSGCRLPAFGLGAISKPSPHPTAQPRGLSTSDLWARLRRPCKPAFRGGSEQSAKGDESVRPGRTQICSLPHQAESQRDWRLMCAHLSFTRRPSQAPPPATLPAAVAALRKHGHRRHRFWGSGSHCGCRWAPHTYKTSLGSGSETAASQAATGREKEANLPYRD